MSSAPNKDVPVRYHNEDLGKHWDVGESESSFQALLKHLEVDTEFKPSFEKTLANPEVSKALEGSVVADLGAGVGWTSALLAKTPSIKHVYSIEPGPVRRSKGPFVAKHFGVDMDKITYVDGSFEDPGIPENSVDVVMMCASFHHCWDETAPALFANIKKILRKDGNPKVIFANEHYVDWVWHGLALASWSKRALTGGERPPFGTWGDPEPQSGEHNRTFGQVKNLVKNGGFSMQVHEHEGDICKSKPQLLARLGWHYYYAILTPNSL